MYVSPSDPPGGPKAPNFVAQFNSMQRSDNIEVKYNPELIFPRDWNL